ncbi:MAG: hypothetical protein HY348_10665 [Nitrospira defluvii]|nr:hypothetical protein [Nitrospira defluvii]
MRAVRIIALLMIMAGGLSIGACAPPTPKVGSLIVPQSREGLLLIPTVIRTGQ